MTIQTPLSKVIFILPIAALAMTTAGCSDNDSAVAPPVSVAPPPAPPPPPPPPPPTTSFNVTPCVNQVIPGTGGRTVANLVIPDVLSIDLSRPSGFPNGRRLPDPVIDVTLAVLFLDVNAAGQSAGTFAGVPVNPAANDVPFPATFPYLAAAQGQPPRSLTTGNNFNFRSDPASAYTRVDRMGMPAVATALIGNAMKIAYNDASPADDISDGGRFAPEIVSVLTGLTNALADDVVGLNLRPCATPS